jgi:hypothetical protein
VLPSPAQCIYAVRRCPLSALTLCTFVLGALSLVAPALAGSDRPDVENGTGDDPTKPLGKIELLDRYTEAPGPGVAEGTTKSTPNQHAVRSDRRAVQALVAMGAELPNRNSGRVDKRSEP